MCCCRFRDSLLVSIALTFASPCLALADGGDTHVVAAAHTALFLEPSAIESARLPGADVHEMAGATEQWSIIPDPASLDSQSQKRLKDGEVLVEAVDSGKTKFVRARICIEQPPEEVWPILVNPYEFENKICPRMKTVELISEKGNSNVIRCGWNICLLIPKITYTVESRFEQQKQVQFRRIAGTFKDFRGSWMLRPLDGGKSSEVLYAMFIDPGIPLPKWLVREALKNELPRTLIGLRERVHAIYAEGAQPETRRPSAAPPVRLPSQAIPLAARKSSI